MIFLILLLQLTYSFAGPNACKIHEWVGGSKLLSSSEFWEEYGQLAQKGAVEDNELIALIAKHTGEEPEAVAKEILQIKAGPQVQAPTSNGTTASQPSASLVGRYTIEIKKSVQKDLAGALPSIREKFDKLLAIMQKLGPAALQELGKSNSNKLEHVRSLGKNAFSIRLDQGWRAVFTMESSGRFTIIDIGRDVYKH
jgi:plasmid maintenance system killer protein